jgi:hypothetical protein
MGENHWFETAMTKKTARRRSLTEMQLKMRSGVGTDRQSGLSVHFIDVIAQVDDTISG